MELSGSNMSTISIDSYLYAYEPHSRSIQKCVEFAMPMHSATCLQDRIRQCWAFRLPKYGKALAAMIMVGLYWGQPVAALDPDMIWPLGRWLSQPHTFRGQGSIFILPWIAIVHSSTKFIVNSLQQPLLSKRWQYRSVASHCQQGMTAIITLRWSWVQFHWLSWTSFLVHQSCLTSWEALKWKQGPQCYFTQEIDRNSLFCINAKFRGRLCVCWLVNDIINLPQMYFRHRGVQIDGMPQLYAFQ